MSTAAQARLWTKDFTLGTAVNFLLMVNYYGLMVVVADYAMKTYDAPAATQAWPRASSSSAPSPRVS